MRCGSGMANDAKLPVELPGSVYNVEIPLTRRFTMDSNGSVRRRYIFPTNWTSEKDAEHAVILPGCLQAPCPLFLARLVIVLAPKKLPC